MKQFTFLSLGILFLLNGCAICTQMPSEYKQNIHTITINKNIPVPAKMVYTSSKSQMAAFFGGVLAQLAVANAVDVPQEAALRQAAIQNNIKIDQIVLHQFVNQISQNSGYHIVQHGPADAELCIKIVDYGFVSPSEFSHGYLKPDLQVSLSLVKDGKIIWTSRDFTTPITHGMPTYTYEQFMQNPNYLAVSWNAAAQCMAQEIISHM